MNIFKKIKLLKIYKKQISYLKNDPLFKQYGFEIGWIGQLGSILKIKKKDIAIGYGKDFDQALVQDYCLKYYKSFFTFLEKNGINLDKLKLQISDLEEDEKFNLDLNDFIFKKITILPNLNLHLKGVTLSLLSIIILSIIILIKFSFYL